MIDDIAMEIEKYDESKDPQGNEMKRLKLPKIFENLEYFLENHKKLFNYDYYKFLEIESIEEHPQVKPIEEEAKEEQPEERMVNDLLQEIKCNTFMIVLFCFRVQLLFCKRTNSYNYTVY